MTFRVKTSGPIACPRCQCHLTRDIIWPGLALCPQCDYRRLEMCRIAKEESE